mmetsp:Transcript_143639/g.275900  ORF Transcript_143639/g.275900 Transcript_143639/m.275900 type:complete len:273 (+) Transcript_143639:80-898(+)
MINHMAVDDAVRVSGLISRVEEHVPSGNQRVLEGECAEPAESDFHVREVIHVLEQLVPLQVRSSKLTEQLLTQLLGQKTQNLNALVLHLSLLPLYNVLEVLQNAPGDLLGNALLLQIAAQHPKLLGCIRIHVPECCHRCRDAANKGGECHEREHQDDDRHCTLPGVLWKNLHGCRSELRQRPMHGRCVLVADVSPHHFVFRYPARLSVCHHRAAKPIPHACNTMVQEENEEQQLQQVEKQVCVFRADLVLKFSHHAPQLQKAQKPQYTDCAK